MAPTPPLTRAIWSGERVLNSSLDGLEKVIPPGKPLPLASRRYEQEDLFKPLPPIPRTFSVVTKLRRASSVYSLTQPPTPYAYEEQSIRDNFLSSHKYAYEPEPQDHLPVAGSLGFQGEYQHHGDLYTNSDTMLAIRRNSTVKPPLRQQPLLRQEQRALHQEQTPPHQEQDGYFPPWNLPNDERQSRWERKPKDEANRFAENYKQILPARLGTAISEFKSLKYQSSFTSFNSYETDLVENLMPPPLWSNILNPQTYIPRSSISSTSTPPSPRTFPTTLRNLQPTMHFSRKHRKNSFKPTSNFFTNSSSQDTPTTSTTTPMRERLSSFASQKGASLQRRLSEMYGTLTSLSIPKTKANKAVSKHRSPAIPITPYQQMGPNAWGSSPRSPLSGNDSDEGESGSRFSWLRAIIERKREEKREKRRQWLKKQIVVVGLVDQSVHGWL